MDQKRAAPQRASDPAGKLMRGLRTQCHRPKEKPISGRRYKIKSAEDIGQRYDLPSSKPVPPSPSKEQETASFRFQKKDDETRLLAADDRRIL